LAAQGVNQNEISGLSFGPDGKLYVASTQGEIYKVSLS
jgi:glucose/arabinose dehydrogenase